MREPARTEPEKGKMPRPLYRRRLLAAVGLGILLAATVVWAGNPVSSAAPTRPEGEPDAVLAFSLNEKADLAARQAQAQREGQADPAPRDLAQSPALPQVQNPRFREGLIEGEPGPFYSGEFRAVNLWQAQGPEGFLQVYAGALGEDPSQGALVVLLTSFDFSKGDETWYLTPQKGGALRIIGEMEGHLQLEAEDGFRYDFDLESFLLQGEDGKTIISAG